MASQRTTSELRIIQDAAIETACSVREKLRKPEASKLAKVVTTKNSVTAYYEAQKTYGLVTENDFVAEAKILAAEFFCENRGLEYDPMVLTLGVSKCDELGIFGWVCHPNGGASYRMDDALAKGLWNFVPKGRMNWLWYPEA